jgi:hypothetical protein
MLASTVVIGGQSLDMVIVQPLHRSDYPAIEKQLVARLMLARISARPRSDGGVPNHSQLEPAPCLAWGDGFAEEGRRGVIECPSAQARLRAHDHPLGLERLEDAARVRRTGNEHYCAVGFGPANVQPMMRQPAFSFSSTNVICDGSCIGLPFCLNE